MLTSASVTARELPPPLLASLLLLLLGAMVELVTTGVETGASGAVVETGTAGAVAGVDLGMGALAGAAQEALLLATELRYTSATRPRATTGGAGLGLGTVDL